MVKGEGDSERQRRIGGRGGGARKRLKLEQTYYGVRRALWLVLVVYCFEKCRGARAHTRMHATRIAVLVATREVDISANIPA